MKRIRIIVLTVICCLYWSTSGIAQTFDVQFSEADERIATNSLHATLEYNQTVMVQPVKRTYPGEISGTSYYPAWWYPSHLLLGFSFYDDHHSHYWSGKNRGHFQGHSYTHRGKEQLRGRSRNGERSYGKGRNDHRGRGRGGDDRHKGRYYR